MAPLDWSSEHTLGDDRLDSDHQKMVREMSAIAEMIQANAAIEEIKARLLNLIGFLRIHAEFEEKVLMRDFEHGDRLHHKVEHTVHHETFVFGLTYLMGCLGNTDPAVMEIVIGRAIERSFLEMLEHDRRMLELLAA